MKKYFNILLMAAVVCGLSIAVTSCHDKNDDSNSGSGEEEQAQQALEQQERDNTAFAVLDYLANVSNAPVDFLSGIYEPTIGLADDGDATTRIVYTNDMETAAQCFADLAEADVDEDTPTYTWSDERLGTLTYTKSTDGKSWATVDVSIKQVPHLQKIIYRSPEQADNNGGFEGTAYYRFGDVVSKKNANGVEEFWICVRPAFGPEGKGDSHWVTVSPLPSANVWTYTGSNGIKYALPTMLGDNHEHSQNFAELLFAICFPEEWENNIINNPYKSVFNKGVPMFHDFDKSNIKYHRSYFWKRVQSAWSRRAIMGKVFGMSGNLSKIQNMLKSDDGLNLLTNGYSWYTTFSNSPTLYRYRFVNGEGKQSNMHQEPKKGGLITKYHSVSAEVIKSKIKLNVNDDYSYENPGWSISDFFGTSNRHYIIRHATGAELASDGKEDPKEKLEGVFEEYRYNQFYGITDLNVNPEVLDREMGNVVNNKALQQWKHYRGDSHYRFGDIYQDENGHKWMVLLMAGSHLKNNNEYHGDSACYSELISIDGLTPSADKRKITNLPTRDQAVRAATFLHNYNIYVSLRYKMETAVLKNDPLYLSWGKTVLNQVETCSFDPRMLFQVVRAQQEKHWNRQPSFLASVAYNDPNDTSGKQRLLRVVSNAQNAKSEYLYYLWEHYVEKPDSTSEFYADTLYNDQPIYLQDIAYADWVGKYGEDSYARQPIYSWDAWSDGVTGPYREPRGVNDVDKKANDVTYYYYDMAKWKNRTFPRDMWNEPVLMFRMTAVYDRGDAEYATVTVDGHQLTPLKERDWIDADGDDFWMILKNTYNAWTSVTCNSRDNLWLDGKRFDWPDPLTTWKKEYK